MARGWIGNMNELAEKKKHLQPESGAGVFGGGGGSRTPVRKRIHKDFSGRRRLLRETFSPRSHRERQADTPFRQVSFIMRGMGKAYHTHVHH